MFETLALLREFAELALIVVFDFGLTVSLALAFYVVYKYLKGDL